MRQRLAVHLPEVAYASEVCFWRASNVLDAAIDIAIPSVCLSVFVRPSHYGFTSKRFKISMYHLHHTNAAMLGDCCGAMIGIDSRHLSDS